jgi:hypothetical protein
MFDRSPALAEARGRSRTASRRRILAVLRLKRRRGPERVGPQLGSFTQMRSSRDLSRRTPTRSASGTPALRLVSPELRGSLLEARARDLGGRAKARASYPLAQVPRSTLEMTECREKPSLPE